MGEREKQAEGEAMNMKTEYELNKEYAEELSKLILENPTLRVIAWIDSEGISDEYDCWSGNLYKPRIQTIAYSEAREHYIERDGDDFEDCVSYYGYDAEDWDDDTLAKNAARIPWEDVIAVRVSAI